MSAPLRYQPCAICRGDGCAACDQAGFFPVATATYAPVQRAAVLQADRGGRFVLAICRDGWAKADGFCYPRWALCASNDGKLPAWKYRNGGPEHLVRTTASKHAPDWMAALAAHVAAFGPLPLGELVDLAEAWKRARGMPRQVAL